MKNLFDTHNHSQFSFDGKRTTIESSSRSAHQRGLAGLCFTDHYDIFVPDDNPDIETIRPQDFNIAEQQAEITRVQSFFEDGFKVLKGIEIGMNETSREQTARILTEHSFDQVIASVHYLENCDPYYGGFFAGKDWKTAYGTYLETIYKEAVHLGDFDIIGHYDYVARYSPYTEDGLMYKDFADIFDALFTYLIENGKGLEINTKSCTGSKGRKTTIDSQLLIRYLELGGEIISLGSDSHDAALVGDGLKTHSELLRSLGFRWTSHYEKRQLVQLPL